MKGIPDDVLLAALDKQKPDADGRAMSDAEKEFYSPDGLARMLAESAVDAEPNPDDGDDEGDEGDESSERGTKSMPDGRPGNPYHGEHGHFAARDESRPERPDRTTTGAPWHAGTKQPDGTTASGNRYIGQWEPDDPELKEVVQSRDFADLHSAVREARGADEGDWGTEDTLRHIESRLTDPKYAKTGMGAALREIDAEVHGREKPPLPFVMPKIDPVYGTVLNSKEMAGQDTMTPWTYENHMGKHGPVHRRILTARMRHMGEGTPPPAAKKSWPPDETEINWNLS